MSLDAFRCLFRIVSRFVWRRFSEVEPASSQEAFIFLEARLHSTSRDVIKLDFKESKFSIFLRCCKKWGRVSISDVGFRRCGEHSWNLRRKSF